MDDRIKYPRTPHLPWSPGASKDDLKVDSLPWADDDVVIITEKMDGENTTIAEDYIHARSVNSGYHPTRTWVQNWAAEWQWLLNSSERICGENLYAAHSIVYRTLPHYFLGFSYWTDQWCHSWPETLAKFKSLGITPVHTYKEMKAKDLHTFSFGTTGTASDIKEGFVVRSKEGFPYWEFDKNVMKYVRPGHVLTDRHWLNQPIVPNILKDDIWLRTQE